MTATPDPTTPPTGAPTPRRRTLRAFIEAGIPVRADRQPNPRPAHRVRPGDQIVRILTIQTKAEWQAPDGTNMVTITTDDGASQDFNPDDALVVWPPDSFPPL